MACRIHNLSKHRLALDLRGGRVMYVEPNQISPPLREEMLYDNVHLTQWVHQGLVRRVAAKMSDVLEHEGKATGAKPPAASAKTKAAGEEKEAAADGGKAAAGPADASQAKSSPKATKPAADGDAGESDKGAADKKPASKPAKDQ